MECKLEQCDCEPSSNPPVLWNWVESTVEPLNKNIDKDTFGTSHLSSLRGDFSWSV